MVLDALGSPSTATPDMRELMAAVGEVLLCWGYVENAILDRLAALGGEAAKPSKTSPLARWKRAETATVEVAKLHDEIERLADIRNALAHGLASATVDPKNTRGAGVTCRTPSGDRHIPFATLTETRHSLFRLSHAIRASKTGGPMDRP